MNANACFVSVIPALAELEVAYKEAMEDPAFQVRGRIGAQCEAYFWDIRCALRNMASAAGQ
jgi:hypothetical protein